MANQVIDQAYTVADENALRALFPPTHDLAIQKVQNRVGQHLRAFIERCPFVCISTQNADGAADISPRGDPAGFVKILDDQTLAIPDRPGNNRLDTLSNILTNPNVGLLFMIPGFDETMRVNGKASLSTDPDLLRRMAVQDRVPTIAIVVQIEETFIHCAKAYRRAHMWDPAYHQDRKSFPSLMKIVLDETGTAPDDADQTAMDAALEADYQATMY